ncbi:MAG TPA: nuclear transport factor 2 family protein [Pyrinomonadaceae bacterium]
MSRIHLPIVLLLVSAVFTTAQTSTPDAAELTKLLNDFLAGASRSDPAMHDRFWADDLIYTRSAGRRVTKAEVMRDVRSAPVPKPDDPKTTYTAEDVRIQQYGDTAIVAFRLVARTERQGTTQMANLLNSGTFLKRNGKWQVVNWQSTRMARSPEQDKKDVLQTHAAFFQALFASDFKKLEELTDPTFIWLKIGGNQESRKQLLDNVSSGQLKYSKLETINATVSITGDTAVVRGSASVQQISASGSTGSGPNPLSAFYTLVFVNQGGAWKAVAMQASRS